ncbi:MULTISPECIES: sulfotransferase [unclassified Mesorhizobium]|uniref:sulfotransferase n=1 Tax=Mesorhizobium sp. M8A.F.Ca.ET.218.01.1.1 TaxID=2563971 RepID=UPI001FE1E933|nr:MULTISPECIES: sulfotransferase [unclassified Mesorhizobium]
MSTRLRRPCRRKSCWCSRSEGWGPLCHFLDVAQPNEPFPNLNDRETIKKIIRDIIKGSYIMLGLTVAAITAVIAALWWWLG